MRSAECGSLYVDEIRGGVVEARHKVHAVAYHGNDRILTVGNPSFIVPMRSVAKPFMLRPLQEEADRHNIHITPAMLSIMASSHNGERAHRDLVEQILSLSDSSCTDLHCGSHLPYYSWLYDEYFTQQDIEKRQLFHNCSGKHAGMLLLAHLMGVPRNNYWEATHSVQERITASVKEQLHIGSNDAFTLALDGCGVPTYCVELDAIAKAYQRMKQVPELMQVRQAILDEPFYNSGTDRIEMAIIQECSFMAKSGSSGLFCISADDIGIAIKVEDGHDDISESAIVDVMATLGLLTAHAQETLRPYREQEIKTSTGVISGRYVPIWEK